MVINDFGRNMQPRLPTYKPCIPQYRPNDSVFGGKNDKNSEFGDVVCKNVLIDK